MDIKNDEQLRQIMIKICEDVIDKVSKELLRQLQERIKSDTYGGHGVNKVYPNFSENESEFYNAFKWDKLQVQLKEITQGLYYDWQGMTTNQPEVYKHKSYIDSWGDDTREKLFDWLNIDGQKGTRPNLFLSVDRKPYWTLFLKQAFGGEILSLFDKEFGKYGIKR